MSKLEITPEMEAAFDEVSVFKTPFEIEKFTLGQHVLHPSQYSQCMLQMRVLVDNYRLAELDIEEKEIDLAEVAGTERRDEIKRERLRVSIASKRRELLSWEREFDVYKAFFEASPVKYTREQLDQASVVETCGRIERQAVQDFKAALTHVSTGNQDCLRMLGADAEALLVAKFPFLAQQQSVPALPSPPRPPPLRTLSSSGTTAHPDPRATTGDELAADGQ